MDEAEKYQQRLQAIAEKRRLQEEQDRAKRQQEDEKLRLQQLKRKSLRDQWLMEGPPLSPDSAGPRSPLWGIQTQQTEAHKLQSEIIDKTHKHKEDGSTSAQSHTDLHDNGERVNAVTSHPSGGSANGEENPSHDTSLTNGTAPDEKSHSAPLQHVNDISKGVETLLFLGYTEAGPGQGLCNDDEDDVSAVIRAERVIVTEEGEEVTQDTKAIDKEEREKQREEKGEEVREEEPEKEGEEEQVEEKEKEREEEKEEGGEEEKEKGREEGGEEKKEKGREEGGEKETKEGGEEGEEEETKEGGEEETKEGEEEGEEDETKEGGEEERETERAEEHVADVQIHLEMCTEAGEDTEFEESLRNNNREIKADADSSKEDTKEISQSDEETSEDADPETKPVKDSATKSALNTDLILDADPAAVIEQETASAETPGGAVQTPSVSAALPASALNPNGAQKSPDPASPSTNSAAQFQEIPLDGATVEEEPLLAMKAGPQTEAMNPDQSEGAKTKTCQCCTVM
ncbi:hypothetical protein KOW79_010493 [Hemibagrus wyckioides]|uniref:Paralemmin-3-like n=2 Tax=Hemibagrus wyckioides TaxID=337641 RepID=A0A9D3NUC8_9TELE|nr:paralemmin-3 isoform X3 [Hemibagrus wyckioides]XP_058259350.1 paralemmin-3 isoform X3 [Hemibagrus wyckioides]XP_058259351.1 paralemmin-3 isoform X3 [Hemibagrus wyckioides]KAG7327092.1 hypothetical protein KOW79_010493 [Hemibagrus wyckioides]